MSASERVELLPRHSTVAPRLAGTLWVVSALLLVPALVLNLRRPQYGEISFTTGELALGLGFVAFGWFGALIVSRDAGNPIGWLLCTLSMASSLNALSSEYALYGLIVRPGAAPGAAALAWTTVWQFAPLFGLLALLLLLFPTGHPISSRWRWVLWLAVAANVLVVVGALSLWPQRGVAMLRIDVPDPVGLFGLVYNLGEWGVIVAAVAAAASLVVRFRRARGIERQQLKWLLYAAVMFGVAIPLVSIVLAGLGVSSELAVDAVGAVLVAGLPAALGVAILKYRLYDIDRIINRTLVYGLLTATLGLAYAGVVLVLGQLFGEVGGNPPSWAVAGATLTVAALFQPTRRRIQQEVDRRFNRRRYNAARTVEAFSARLREQVDLDTLSTELLGVVDQTMQPTTVSLWLRPAPQASPHGQ
jgi:hypothetical protein